MGFSTSPSRPASRPCRRQWVWITSGGDFEADRAFDRFGDNEAAFIADRDSFYMATVSQTGWPYVQHRGGPSGFLKVVDERTLAFADYRGNHQYISTGKSGG